MNEKEIRERIERFLRKTARTVVVPASVGLGLSLSGCDHHALSSAKTDASHQGSDVASNSGQPDLAPDLPRVMPPYMVYIPPADAKSSGVPDTAAEPDASGKSDLPIIAVPYLVYMPPPDAGPETAAPFDSGIEAAPRDAGIESPLSLPPPPYMVPFPPPPYLVVSVAKDPDKLG